MTVHISDFGDVLVSSPAGRDAFLGARAYLFPDAGADTEFTLDFDGVKVLTPSWADEFIQGIKQNYSSHISYVNTDNESVSAVLKML